MPQKHGEFNDISTYFWLREYWQVPKNQDRKVDTPIVNPP